MKKYFIPFDIETIPLPFDQLDESQQEYLLRGANTLEEIDRRKREMALSPMTGQIITIGLKVIEHKIDKINGETYSLISSGALVFDPNIATDKEITQKKENGDVYFYANEARILQMFWEILKKYKTSTLISFNGRNFDAPFLLLRSALLNVIPSRNIMQGTKYNYPDHIDLLDELTFHNPNTFGATRRFNFNFYSISFGIESPKSQGIDGANVHEYFLSKEYDTIAQYCLRDVEATWQLFLRIKDFLFL